MLPSSSEELLQGDGRGTEPAIKQTTLSFSSKWIEYSADSDFGRRIARKLDWSKQDKSISSTVSIAFDVEWFLALKDIVRLTGASDRRRFGLQAYKVEKGCDSVLIDLFLVQKVLFGRGRFRREYSWPHALPSLLANSGMHFLGSPSAALSGQAAANET